MVRARRLHVLFVRSGEERGLPSTLRLGLRRERHSEIPFGLLRLASVVKLESPHRVSFHDERHPDSVKVRTAAAIHKPDVAVVWIDPALLAAGLEAARAVRHAGCPLVLGTGPMVDVWPEGARRIPELDGLLGSAAANALLGALDVIAAEEPALHLTRALADSSRDEAFEAHIDRKLVDYATYTSSPVGWPPTQLPPPSQVMGLGSPSDKGRAAASRVVLDSLWGNALDPTQVLTDLRECDLLGIPWQELRPSPACKEHTRSWWEEFLSLLKAMSPQDRQNRSRRRVQIPPNVVRSLPLTEFRSLFIEDIDLGDVDCGNSDAVEDASAAIRAIRRAGVKSSLTAMLGRGGAEAAAEERGLRRLTSTGALLDAQLQVDIDGDDSSAWSSWLEAPGPEFIPPGTDPERLHLVERTQRQRRQRLHSAPRVQALGRRLGNWIERA